MSNWKQGAFFEKIARKAFDEIDIDKTGKADYKEVVIGLLKFYDKLNSKLPEHVTAPKRAKMFDLCKKYDTDEDGTLDFPEFLELAKVLVGSRTNFFDSLPWKIGHVLVLKLAVFPLVALGIVETLKAKELPLSEKVPVASVAVVLELTYKLLTK